MIRPPFGERAKAATSFSISSALGMLTGVASTLSEGAMALMTPNWAIPPGLVCHAGDAWRDLLKQLQPLPAHGVFGNHEASGIAAGSS
jgi:hypothetical protein